MKYEVAITGSSRPSLYPIFWESFNKMVKMSEKPKITVYEDVIFKNESNKVRQYIENKVDRYVEFEPNKRLGYVFNQLLNDVKTKYYIYLQEDWKFLKEIDVDKIIDVMEKNDDIKQVWFPKKLEGKTYKLYCRDVINRNGLNLIPWHRWAFLPHIGRTDFVRDIWSKGKVNSNDRPETPFKKVLLKYIKINQKNFNNAVSFILGEKYDEYIQHLGLPSDDGIQFDLRSKIMIERKHQGYKK